MIRTSLSRNRPSPNRGFSHSSGGRGPLIALHISPIAAFLIPFGHLLVPLLLWLFYKGTHQEADRHGRMVLNFQLSMTLYYFMFGIASAIILALIPICTLAIPLVFALFALILAIGIHMILNTIRVKNGEEPHYPYNIHFLK